MPSSPSSSAQAARQRLGTRLRQMRTEAGITGVEFARRAGWRGSAQVSMLEKGHRTITADHVRLWCRICGTPTEREAALLAEQSSVVRMWIALREHHDLGLDARQRTTVGDLYSRIASELNYQTKVIPGLLQTEGYMTEVLRGVRRDRRLVQDDVADAVATRMARQRNLHRAGTRWTFLLEETVLRYQYFAPEVHRRQLEHLTEAMRLPSVAVAIVPLDAPRCGVGHVSPSASITSPTVPPRHGWSCCQGFLPSNTQRRSPCTDGRGTTWSASPAPARPPGPGSVQPLPFSNECPSVGCDVGIYVESGVRRRAIPRQLEGPRDVAGDARVGTE